jgi:hypothetical protein
MQDDLQLEHAERVHAKAVDVLNDAIIAAIGTGMGKTPAALAADINILEQVRDRINARHVKLQAAARAVDVTGDFVH